MKRKRNNGVTERLEPHAQLQIHIILKGGEREMYWPKCHLLQMQIMNYARFVLEKATC